VALFPTMKRRGGLQVENDGITLRGFVRRRHLGWQAIEKFEPASSTRGPELKISLTDGQEVRAPGFKTQTAKDRVLAALWLDELNQRANAAHQTQLR
jgi:hypothetical protein